MSKTLQQHHPFDQGLLQSFILAPDGSVYCIRTAPTPILSLILRPYLEIIISKTHYLSDIYQDAKEIVSLLDGRDLDKQQRWWIFYLLSEQRNRPPMYFSMLEAQLAQRDQELKHHCLNS